MTKGSQNTKHVGIRNQLASSGVGTVSLSHFTVSFSHEDQVSHPHILPLCPPMLGALQCMRFLIQEQRCHCRERGEALNQLRVSSITKQGPHTENKVSRMTQLAKH